jgi:2-dehydro-3-deoxyphosphooctonate aldolase (KDO 8-P synthase)
MESHPDPANALSDGPNSWPLELMEALLVELKALDDVTKSHPFLEDQLS